MSLLTVRNMSKRFGGLTAVDDVSITVNKGEIYGLIGPNGAGKTTCFNLITGLYPADSGEFSIADKPYFPKHIEKVTAAGIARTFQNVRLFNDMSVLENVMVGRHVRTRNGLWAALSRHKRAREEEKQTRELAWHWLEYTGIAKFAHYRACDLAYGHQRRLEIARALATDPLLLALDEPAAGMNAAEKVALGELLIRLRDDGKTLLRDGLVMVPEGRGIFSRMTVLENLQMGAWLRRDIVTVKREMNETFERFPRLGERQHQLAGLLSGGEQQLLALNRALLSRPRLLILDEPSMGLAPKMVENIFAVIAGLRERGVALLLIEQNARLALEVTDSAWVMDSGSIVHHGESKALLNDDQIAQIYLGEMPV